MWRKDWRKPSPGMLISAMAFYDCEPKRALFVGNGVDDYTAAKAAGCDFEWARYFFSEEDANARQGRDGQTKITKAQFSKGLRGLKNLVKHIAWHEENKRQAEEGVHSFSLHHNINKSQIWFCYGRPNGYGGCYINLSFMASGKVETARGSGRSFIKAAREVIKKKHTIKERYEDKSKSNEISEWA